MTVLFISATLVVLGIAMNRIDVFLVAYKPLYAAKSYFPSPYEIMLTIGLVCAFVLVYRAIVMIFPVITHSENVDLSFLKTQQRVLADD